MGTLAKPGQQRWKRAKGLESRCTRLCGAVCRHSPCMCVQVWERSCTLLFDMRKRASELVHACACPSACVWGSIFACAWMHTHVCMHVRACVVMRRAVRKTPGVGRVHCTGTGQPSVKSFPVHMSRYTVQILKKPEAYCSRRCFSRERNRQRHVTT